MFNSTNTQGSPSSSKDAKPAFHFSFPTPAPAAANTVFAASPPPAVARGRRQPVNRLDTIDLAAIRTLFVKEHPNYADDASLIEAEYRKFLAIKQQHADKEGLLFAAPPAIVAFWRTHVMHTASYSAMWQAASVELHFEPELNQVDHVSYRRRIGNTVAVYRAMYGKDPRDVDPVVWDEIVDVADEEEASNKLPAAADVAAPAPDKTKVELTAPSDTPQFGAPAATVVPAPAPTGAQQPAQEPDEPMPEFDPDTLYDSDAEDAAEQDMSQVWSLTIKSITGQVYQYRFKKDIQVGQLKHVIERRDGLPPCMQRLIFSGKQLQNFAWLKKDEGLVDGSVMHLVVRLRGC